MREARLEFDLLASCARRAIRRRVDDRAAIAHEIDWPHALCLAAVHRLTPLVHLGLGNDSLIPAAVRTQLALAAEANARRSLFMTSRLVELLKTLGGAGIDVMPFKGPVLAALAYGNVGLRQFGDLDILVRRDEVPAAVAVLAAAGYRGSFPDTPSRRRILLEQWNQLTLRSGERLQVELHWDVLPKIVPARVDLDGLWRRTSIVSLFGTEVTTPSVDDLTILLAVHAAKHRWRRLLWLVDFAALVRSMRPDWRQVRALAEQAGIGRMLRVALLLTLDVLEHDDDDIPAALRQWARADAQASSIAKRVEQRYLVDRGEAVNPFEDMWSHTQSLERWRDKWRFGTRALFTPTSMEWDLIRLPSPLGFLYPVIRAGRLTVKYGSRAFLTMAPSARRA